MLVGYYDGAEVKQRAEAGITTYIAKPLTSVNKKRGLFTKQDFRYDHEKDCYHCPQGEELTFRYDAIEANRKIRYYATPQCRGCPIKEKCTTNKAGRRITRWVDEQLLEVMARKVRARSELMKERQQIVASSIRYDQAGDEPGLLFDERLTKSWNGDEFDGLELQHQTNNQHHRSQEDDRSSYMINDRYFFMA